MRRAVVAICLLLAGCSGTGLAAPAQTSIPAPTFTQQPTLVSTPAEVPVALVLPTATPKPSSCAEVSGEYIAKTIELKREWSDAVKLAEHAPRIQLGDRIDKLQTLRRRAEDLPAPGCAVESKLVLVSGMRSTIGALMDFMSQNTGASASSVLLPGTSVDIEASEHAMSALAEMPHSCLPLSSEDVKQSRPAIFVCLIQEWNWHPWSSMFHSASNGGLYGVALPGWISDEQFARDARHAHHGLAQHLTMTGLTHLVTRPLGGDR
jgi:hypothetical protein